MRRGVGSLILVLLLAGAALAEPAKPFKALARMPVQEVTVFKDGHAFVLHSGSMPVDTEGNVVLDYLPTPVIGTFWPFSADKRAKLSAVTASQRKVLVDHTTLNLKELLEANVGAEVVVTEIPPPQGNSLVYNATILELPAQGGDDEEEFSPPYSGEKLTQKGSVVLLKVGVGVKVVNLDRIQDVSFVGSYKKVLPREEFRNLLTLKLDWAGGQPQKEAEVGLLYLQRGIRWIPNYKVSIDGKGQATVKLQATLINELADLEDATAHLVIGVPSFAFKDTTDPIALQQSLAQLSPYFRQDSPTNYAFSNALMTQAARPMMSERRAGNSEPAAPVDLGPEVAESGRSEDLFVYTIKHVTLRKGQRMVMPIGEFAMKYRDVYTLEIPFAPPAEVWRNLDSSRQTEMARLLSGPKVMHKIRLYNRSDCPLTTAPALILLDDRILAQGLMTYAAPGSDTDLDITNAVDIRVKKTDNELKRTPNAAVWQSDQYGRVDLAGKITLTSFRKEPVEVEVVRNVLGNADTADHDGKIEMVNVFEDASFASGSGALPYWWSWFSWPWWWHHFNGVGRVTWTVDLQPGKPVDLGYTWNYYWR
jgi:hypothetical protein